MTGVSRLLLMAALLVTTRGVVAQNLPDFNGAVVTERGFCKVDDETVECMEVLKEDTVYVIFHEGYHIYFIFRVKKGSPKPYMPDVMEQIYPPKGVSI